MDFLHSYSTNANLKFRAWQKQYSQFCIGDEYLNRLGLWSLFIIKPLWIFNGNFRICSTSLRRGSYNRPQKVCVFQILHPVIHYTRRPRRSRLPILFQDFKSLSKMKRELQRCLSLACSCALSAFGLGMVSLTGLLFWDVLYVQRSHVVTPHKLLITEKSTYPVRNPSCCCGKRLRQLLLRPSLCFQITCVAGEGLFCAD